ncbi:MAG TPA: ferritin family protein [Gammaproteobacteria bacterium]
MSFTLPEFLAHAVAMEGEAAERYVELADMMEAHANQAVAGVFREMHRFSTLHRDSIVERSAGIELPALRSWQYRWTQPPEMGDEDAFDYTLTPHQALLYARENEIRAMQFYGAVAEQTEDAEVQRLAAEFAAEEHEHASALADWLDRTPP